MDFIKLLWNRHKKLSKTCGYNDQREWEKRNPPAVSDFDAFACYECGTVPLYSSEYHYTHQTISPEEQAARDKRVHDHESEMFKSRLIKSEV